MFDAELYRDKSEVEPWKTARSDRDVHARVSRTAARRTDACSAALERVRVGRNRRRRCSFAEAGTWEPVEDLLKDVYTPVESPRPDAGGAA